MRNIFIMLLLFCFVGIASAEIYRLAARPDGIDWDQNGMWSRFPPDAVLYLPFSQSTNSYGLLATPDFSGEGNDGDVENTTTWTNEAGGCYLFGTNDYIDVGDIDGIVSNMTLSAWIKLNDTSGDSVIMVKPLLAGASPFNFWRDAVAAGGEQVGNTNTISFTVQDGTQVMSISAENNSLNDTLWHHVVCTFQALSATGGKIYIDGTLRQTGNTSSVDFMEDTVGPFRVSQEHPTSYFHGLIDEATIVPRTLTATEVSDLYDIGFATHPSSKFEIIATGADTIGIEHDDAVNLVINWGDGSVSNVTAGGTTETLHTYAGASTNVLVMSGACTRFQFKTLPARLSRILTPIGGIEGITSFLTTFKSCSSLTSIPAGLFDNNTSVVSFREVFHACTSLTAIPSGLFDKNVAVAGAGFYQAFRICSSITNIPSGLFDKNVNVSGSAFREIFSGCTSLTNIPSGLFDNNPLPSIGAFSFAFNSTQITEIPSGLFDACPDVSSDGFRQTFAGCTSLTAIPSGLFDSNTVVSSDGFESTFNGCTGITNIPSGLFDNSILVSSDGFLSTFEGCTGLTNIPSGLFDNNTLVSSSGFQSTFEGCTGITVIPSSLFDNNVALTEQGFYDTFKGCTGITAIPSSLFDNNILLENSAFFGTFHDCSSITNIPVDLFKFNTLVSGATFYQTFRDCASITNIPSGLFDFNVAVAASTFYQTFYNCSGVPEIPSGLFDNNTLATTRAFQQTFRGCTSITNIPTGLFDNNTLVSTFAFQSTFQNCTSLTNAPSSLFKYNAVAVNFIETFENCPKLVIPIDLFYDAVGAIVATNRFVGQTVDFTSFFEVSAKTAVGGGAPDLWNAVGTLTGTDAFTGHDATSLTNWAVIPAAWGGPL